MRITMPFLILFCLLPWSLCATAKIKDESIKTVEWSIIGAGPAGIIVAAMLRDLGVPDNQIIWIDEEFNVGRLGKYYTMVPGNIKTKLFVEFITACKTFLECDSKAITALCNNYDLEKEYPLKIIVDPLQDITTYLQTKITSFQTRMKSLNSFDDYWYTELESGMTIRSRHVVLATGSHPRTLDYSCKCEIPLDIALDKSQLAKNVSHEDIIAVIGSAHSAILVLKYLSELAVTRIINFYTKPIEYNHDENGLGGETAQWAKEVLEKNPPRNIDRILNTPETLKTWLPLCNKIIYACGFERNELPPINGKPITSYDDKSGVIAPRLFGIGIAFPEISKEDSNSSFARIGLVQFLEFAQKVVPQWLINKDSITRFAHFDELFFIVML